MGDFIAFWESGKKWGQKDKEHGIRQKHFVTEKWVRGSNVRNLEPPQPRGGQADGGWLALVVLGLVRQGRQNQKTNARENPQHSKNCAVALGCRIIAETDDDKDEASQRANGQGCTYPGTPERHRQDRATDLHKKARNSERKALLVVFRDHANVVFWADHY